MIKAEWTKADALDLQPTCNQLATDCISRQAALKLILSGRVGDDSPVERHEECNSMLEWAADEVAKMPTAEKRGRWVKLDMHPHLADHKCTACGESTYVPTCMGKPIYLFCPWCGARMGEGEEDE